MPECELRTRVGAGKVQKAMTGRFKGKATVPLDNTAIAGRAIFRVAPNGYTKFKAL